MDTTQPRRRALQTLGAAALATLSPAALRAQGKFPEKPVTLLVPFAPGGIADLTARAVAEQMARSLGQPVVVENRPSAGSIVASSAVAQATPDGHTLLLMSNGNALSASLFRKLPFDVQRDFAPIGLLGAFDLALVVEASGVADPWRIAQYALADPRLALAGVVVLVDAAAVLGLFGWGRLGLERWAPPRLESHTLTFYANAPTTRGADFVCVQIDVLQWAIAVEIVDTGWFEVEREPVAP